MLCQLLELQDFETLKKYPLPIFGKKNFSQEFKGMYVEASKDLFTKNEERTIL